jgi:Zn-finger nucleic acid-binding protein
MHACSRSYTWTENFAAGIVLRDSRGLQVNEKKGEISMKCPKCGTETLNEVFVKGVAVERCSSCSGTWFDARELTQVLAEDAGYITSLRRGSIKEQLAGKKGFCPRDSAELLRVYSSIDRSVILDACAECRGIWLDGGEFDKLFAAGQA